ncbi:CBN-UGT-50 protein [Caenorhabditis brenneri]|uniref:UDP-glucuronosyltransferase n=1 Tax=Caenorhabditis brenneri TaxID=135651 RepID=G0MX64_CAEBE|nr:CBN-UGT-50 protein [Caenorhabditis brenneri]
MRSFLLLFCLTTVYFIVDAAKILVYCPSISKSHVLLCAKYADLLHNASHDTVLFIPSYSSLLNDYDGAKHAKVWRLHNVTDAYDKKFDSFADVMENSHIGFIDRMTYDVDFWMDMCEDVVKQFDRLQPLIDYQFDLAIFNDIDPCNPAIVRSLNIPKTALLSRLPTLPSYVPSMEENPNHDRMSFFERMSNAYKYFQSIVVHYLQDRRVLHIFRKHISPDFPSITGIIRNVSLIMVNTDEIFDISRSYSPKFVYVGMIGAEKHANVTLSEDLDKIFSKGKLGSVFVSFGTVTPFRVLPKRIQSSIFNAIQKLPDYHFILKTVPGDTTTAEMFAGVPNVDFVNWVPQNTILKHEHLKLFVSHGGMNSVLETMYNGVPMVIMPVFTDQFRNGKNVERRGAGKMILRQTVTTETFYDVIHEVLKNNNYETAAKRISRMMKSRPFTPEERVTKWVNFILDHDTFDHFHLESNNLSFFEHNHLDVFFVFIVLPFVTYFVFRRVLKSSS